MAKKAKVAAAKIADAIETPVTNEATSANTEQHIDNNAAPKKLVAVTTEKKAPGKLVAVKAEKAEKTVDPIPANVLEELDGMKLNKVNQIKTLWAAGYTRPQIVLAGYNSSTVYRQVGEYIKKLSETKAEKLEVKAQAEELAAATDIVGSTTDEAIEAEDAEILENEE